MVQFNSLRCPPSSWPLTYGQQHEGLLPLIAACLVGGLERAGSWHSGDSGCSCWELDSVSSDAPSGNEVGWGSACISKGYSSCKGRLSIVGVPLLDATFNEAPRTLPSLPVMSPCTFANFQHPLGRSSSCNNTTSPSASVFFTPLEPRTQCISLSSRRYSCLHLLIKWLMMLFRCFTLFWTDVVFNSKSSSSSGSRWQRWSGKLSNLHPTSRCDGVSGCSRSSGWR